MPAHVEELFSAAYERELRGAQRDTFESHIASCQECHDAYGHYRASVDALRSLPSARMPVTVHLPDAPPVAARASLWQRLFATPARIRLAVAMLVALAGGTGMLLTLTPARGPVAMAVQAPAGSGAQAFALGGSISAEAPRADAGNAPVATAGGGAAVPAPTDRMVEAGSFATCGAPQALPQDVPAQAPAAFAAASTVSDPDIPGQTLSLATTSAHVAPGDVIPIFARLGSSTGSTPGAMPCVALTPVGASSDGAGSVAQPLGVAQVDTLGLTTVHAPFTLARPLMPGTMATDASVAAAGQTLRIPSPLRPGAKVELVAVVPAGDPASRGAPLVAVLTLTVE